MKRLMYILIPVLAVLLMSHNTSAIRQMDPVTCYALADNTVPCQAYPLTTGNEINVISVSRERNPSFDNSYGYNAPFIWALRVQSTSALYINLANGYPYMADIYNVETDCNTVNGNNICNVYITGFINNVYNFNIQMAGRVSAAGASYTIHSVYFSTQQDIYGVNKILDYLKNNPSASAQDIADAVNQPTQDAVDNIDNQSTSDIDSGDSSSATNLLGNIQGIFNQINSIPVGNTCSIAADFGNLNLGNINFCTGKDKLPFPVTFGAYCFELIFVIGTSIILIKQVLSILDWSRR